MRDPRPSLGRRQCNMSIRFRQKHTVAWLITFVVSSWSVALWAQEPHEFPEENTSAEPESMDAIDSGKESSPVRGARLKQTASYINSPLLVTNERVEREAGLLDAAKIFQEATQSETLKTVFVFGGSVTPIETKKSTLGNTAPVQIIDAKRERDMGGLDMKDVFQERN